MASVSWSRECSSFFREAEAGAQFAEGERVAEALKRLAAEIADQPQFLEFALEQEFLVRRVGRLCGLDIEARGFLEGDAAAGVEDAGAERDGGNVAFASGAQAHDEPQRAGRQVRLVRMRHDGRIEQRGSLEGILVGETRADQQPAFLGQFLVRGQPGPDLLEAALEEIPDFQMALVKFRQHLLQQRADLVLGKDNDPGADFDGALLAGDIEGADEHPAAGRKQGGFGTFQVDGLHAGNEGDWLNIVALFCISCISASESRKARVDSAP